MGELTNYLIVTCVFFLMACTLAWAKNPKRRWNQKKRRKRIL